MIKSILAASGLIAGPTFALLTFFSVLLLSIAWCYRPGSKEYYQKMSASILQDGEKS